MIKIKMFQEMWKIHIEEEVWQFETKKEFEETLKKLIDLKDKYGRLKRE